MKSTWIRYVTGTAAAVACFSIATADGKIKNPNQKTPCPTGVLQNSCFGYFPVNWKPWPASCAYVEFECNSCAGVYANQSQVHSSATHLAPTKMETPKPASNLTAPK